MQEKKGKMMRRCKEARWEKEERKNIREPPITLAETAGHEV